MDLTGPGLTRYPHLFRPIRVGKFVLRNRVKYAACAGSNFNTEDGFITDREYARMEGIARTGCAMITNQGAFPDPAGEGRAYVRQIALSDDRYIPGLRKVADMIRRGGGGSTGWSTPRSWGISWPISSRAMSTSGPTSTAGPWRIGPGSWSSFW